MTVSRNKLLWVSVVAGAMLPGAAFGQTRGRHVWREPRVSGLRVIGGDFGRYASGLGALDRSSSSFGGTSVLRSRIGGSTSFLLQRSSLGSSGLPGVTGSSGLSQSTPRTGQTYKAVQLNLHRPGLDVSRAPRTSSEISTEMMLRLHSGLAATGDSSALLAQGEKPITSFVPIEPSRYQEYVKRGESRFREGLYTASANAFEGALTLARYSPEAHLSKAHAKFARGDYNSAAYHLRKALKYFPELALARLQVRGFYDQPEVFVSQVERLRKVAAEPDAQANVWLVLAYVRYFDGAEADAAKALRQAFSLGKRGKDDSMVQAVERFWDGMVAAGKVSGSLAPTTQPVGQTGSGKAPPAQPGRQPSAPPDAERSGSAVGDQEDSGGDRDAGRTGTGPR